MGIGETASVFVEDDLGSDIGEEISLSQARLFYSGILVFILDLMFERLCIVHVNSVASSLKIVVDVRAGCRACEKHFV